MKNNKQLYQWDFVRHLLMLCWKYINIMLYSINPRACTAHDVTEITVKECGVLETLLILSVLTKIKSFKRGP